MPAQDFDSIESAYRSFRDSEPGLDGPEVRTAFYGGALAAYKLMLLAVGVAGADGFRGCADKLMAEFERFRREGWTKGYSTQGEAVREAAGLDSRGTGGGA